MKVFKLMLALGFVVMISATAANAQSAADAAAIKQTALDYIEGWYEGNADRMEKALHPELAKRIVRTNPQNNRSGLGQMSAMSLVQGTRAGGGKDTPQRKAAKRRDDSGCLRERGQCESRGIRVDRLSAHREI